MWSETFFLNLKEFKSQLTSALTPTEIEHTLFYELKSENYKQVVDHFKAGPAFPTIELVECSLFSRLNVLL